MKKIKVSKKWRWILVDDEDYEDLVQYKWHDSNGYARRYLSLHKSISMHTYLMKPPKGMVVDHINHNTMDNRRKNLRVCTPTENANNLLLSEKRFWWKKLQEKKKKNTRIISDM